MHFVNIDPRIAAVLDPINYPNFTLFFQAIGFIRVCFHSFNLMPCDIFVDTMGVAFGYPALKLLFGCKIYSYTHYPFVSNDML